MSITTTKPRTVTKPWGHELVFAETDRYAGKMLKILAGESLSFQYHERKDETIHVLEGTLGLEVQVDGEPRVALRVPAGESFRIHPGMRHRMFGEGDDVLLLEVSSPELTDVVRLEDRYGRAGTTAP